MVALAWASKAMVDLKRGRIVMEVSTVTVQQILNHHESFSAPETLRGWVQRTHTAFLRIGGLLFV